MPESASPEKTEQRAEIQLYAGERPDGQSVLETVQVWVMEEDDCYELVHSPLFVRNLAAGDVFRMDKDRGAHFSVLKRSGKLAVRVFSKASIEALAEELTPKVEKLDGSLDITTERALAYSLHVNIGFSAIEALFDDVMSRYPDTVWYFGNIYDPRDGVTPLNWWDEFINQI